jgi:hypothetical protein
MQVGLAALGSPEDAGSERAAKRGLGGAVHAGREACLELRPCLVEHASQHIQSLRAQAITLLPHFSHKILPDEAVPACCGQHNTFAVAAAFCGDCSRKSQLPIYPVDLQRLD